MARHRARGRRRGSAPTTAPHTRTHTPPRHAEPTEPPWLRVVPTPEDVVAPPPPTVGPTEVMDRRPEVQIIYADGHRVRVPIEDGMVVAMSCVDGQPTMTVSLNEA